MFHHSASEPASPNSPVLPIRTNTHPLRACLDLPVLVPPGLSAIVQSAPAVPYHVRTFHAQPRLSCLSLPIRNRTRRAFPFLPNITPTRRSKTYLSRSRPFMLCHSCLIMFRLNDTSRSLNHPALKLHACQDYPTLSLSYHFAHIQSAPALSIPYISRKRHATTLRSYPVLPHIAFSMPPLIMAFLRFQIPACPILPSFSTAFHSRSSPSSPSLPCLYMSCPSMPRRSATAYPIPAAPVLYTPRQTSASPLLRCLK